VELRAGQQVDRYVLLEPLGEGGQGAVWKARDPLAPGTPCALKLVPVGGRRAADLERARREARSLAQLEHPSLVRASALFEDLSCGVLGIAMELVDGTSLRQLSREGRLSPEQKDQVLEHVARALSYLHQTGIVHRDVKLDNVIVRESFWAEPQRPDGVKVVDLGIAAPIGADRDLTQEGTVIGTLAYLAPELLDPATFGDEASSPRVDVFAFGVMGWLLHSGQHPSGLPATSTAVDYTRAYRARAGAAEGFPLGAIDSRWGPVLTRCLSIAPERRFAEAGSMLDALGGHGPVSIVRPLRDPDDAATAVATPGAMTDPTAPAVSAPRARATSPIGKPTTKPSLLLPVLVLLGAGGVGAFVAAKLVLPEAPRPVANSAHRPARTPPPRASASAGAEPTPPDASASVPALADAVAPEDPCSLACPSGRSCGSEGCAAALDAPDYALRVGRVDVDGAGTSLLHTYRTAELCLAPKGRPERVVCMSLLQTEDGGATDAALEVALVDLLQQGLDLTVRYTVPGRGAATLARAEGVKLPDGGRREVLCKGWEVRELVHDQDTPIERVVIYLDEPGSKPARCP
jgi:serine/threonine-protein kinase